MFSITVLSLAALSGSAFSDHGAQTDRIVRIPSDMSTHDDGTTPLNGATLLNDKAPKKEQPDRPKSNDENDSNCITWNTEARYRGLGYDHIVKLHSECEKMGHCQVSTNVNPKVQKVDVPPKKDVDVVTFVGSPSREFSAKVECRVEPAASP